MTGVLMVPTGNGLPQSVDTAEEVCALPSVDQCQAILDDFMVRQFPVPV